jgi:hypothetical protein
MNWILALSPLQKIAGITFILAKITAIATVPLIFASAADKDFLTTSKYLISLACFLLLTCIATAILSAKERQTVDIDRLLEDPETRKLIEERLKKKR